MTSSLLTAKVLSQARRELAPRVDGPADTSEILPEEPSEMYAFLIFTAAAVTEIAGCFAFWAWMHHGKSPLWLLPGIVLLATFAWLLTLAPTENAGRAYAIYGGIYIATSIGWLWAIDGVRPDRWDLIGSMVCIAGAGIILWGPRTA